MTRYFWRPGTHYVGKADAQIVGEHIEELRSVMGGDLRPDEIVADARFGNSPLHPLFEWNDGEAAHSYRLHQARQIIGSIQIKVDAPRAPEKVTRAFVNVRMPDRHPVYTAVSAALADPAMRGVILERALSELEAWRRRYETLSELALVFEAIEKVRAA